MAAAHPGRETSHELPLAFAGAVMSKNIVKVIEVLAESPKSWEDAAAKAVAAAQKSLRDVKSIYIKDFSAEVAEGKIVNYRITAKLSFKLE
ncbi:dodecin family protein [Pandoraea eparura]|jgi:flavin-binding protein dodecin|nr:dodecin family protein [Pandoraea eparura]